MALDVLAVTVSWVVIEAEIFSDGDRTGLVGEERGLVVDEAAAHGGGWQAHVEDLAAHLAGRPPTDWRSRWAELAPTYRDQRAALVSSDR
jgi:hypothetical protein